MIDHNVNNNAYISCKLQPATLISALNLLFSDHRRPNVAHNIMVLEMKYIVMD